MKILTNKKSHNKNEREDNKLLEKNIEIFQYKSIPSSVLKLDYNLKTPQERNELVKKIVEITPPEQLTPYYLEKMADYIIFAMDKTEKKRKKIITTNRLVTINKREISFDSLVSSIEGKSRDSIYGLKSKLGKAEKLTFNDPITQEDLDNIYELQELIKAIKIVEKQYNKATGKRKFFLKKQLIEMRQDQYVIRSLYRRNYYNFLRSPAIISFSKIEFKDDITFDEKGFPVNNGTLSFFNPKHLEALLCNYSELKAAAYGNFENDLWYMMEDLDNLVERALKDKYPLYYDLLIYKIDGRTNLEIQRLLDESFGIKHSIEYISALWRKKIPKVLALQAQEDYLIWYYTNEEYGSWKRCSRCGEIKLIHSKFFSKNGSSQDGYYSICKCCRNAKSKKNRTPQKRIKNS